ncbi:alpha/beta fold hydrolase [Arthrobacter sp. Helios]|uniref:alpha/beta fold hydrolase n=1 Tax=Arthrobacter sp. Helios TaxID=2828862 RepID=UPI00204D86A2|nr:alpha/beta fold hydrolase [Arthrobacter sp. Helios]UPO77889.1 alpha/beta fold hydrolase [Arthrobacter sp. Helios]
MKVLFVHGAGGWLDDQALAAELRSTLDNVEMPRFPDGDMSAAAWREVLDRQLESLGPELVIVGHSFGASILLLRLADGWPGELPRGHGPPGDAVLGA